MYILSSPLANAQQRCARAHGISRALVVIAAARRVYIRSICTMYNFSGSCVLDAEAGRCGLPLDPVSKGFESKPLSLSPRRAPGSGLCTGLAYECCSAHGL